MASLFGRSVKDTYRDLIQVSNANIGIDSVLRTVSDGEGTDSALQISTTAAKIIGDLEVTGNIIASSVTDSGAQALITSEQFTGTGVLQVFTLQRTLPSASSLIVSVDGVLQQPTTYEVVGNELTFSEAPSNGAAIDVRLIAKQPLEALIGPQGIQGIQGPVGDVTVTDASLVTATGSTTARNLASRFSDVVNVRDFGAKGDGVTNDTAAFLAAKVAVGLRGGGTIYAPAGTYNVTGLTWDKSAVSLVGDSGGYIFGGAGDWTGTVLKYTGTAEGTLLSVQAPFPAGGNTDPVSSVRIENIVLDGDALAGTGLKVLTAANCHFRNIMVRDCTTQGVYTGVVAEDYPGLNYVYQCQFENIGVNVSGAAHGFVLDGDPGGPGGNCTTFSEFRSLHVVHHDGTAYKLVDCDSNVFINLGTSRTGGTGIGLELGGSNSAGNDKAHHNFFYGLWVGAGGIVARGAGLITPSTHNHIFGLNTIDNAPLPVIEAGATLYYTTTDGRTHLGSLVTDNDINTPYVNYIRQIGSSAGGGGVQSKAEGADATISYDLYTKGVNAVFRIKNDAGNTVAQINASDATPANHVQILARGAGSAPQINAAGSDTNTALRLQSKGTSGVEIGSTTDVNRVVVRGTALGGGAPAIKAEGSDADLSLDLHFKGTNGLLRVKDDAGLTALQVGREAAAANWVSLLARAAGSAPQVTVAGAATDVTLHVNGKGAGGTRIEGSSGKVGFLGTAPVVKPTITGSRGGNAALASLLTALAAYGLITDSTTA